MMCQQTALCVLGGWAGRKLPVALMRCHPHQDEGGTGELQTWNPNPPPPLAPTVWSFSGAAGGAKDKGCCRKISAALRMLNQPGKRCKLRKVL